LSARKLSLRIGKNAGYIHLLETAKNFNPTFETLCEIIEACDSSLEEFFYHDISSYKVDMKIIDKLKGLPIEKKEHFLGIL